jgi:hypothetical protein
MTIVDEQHAIADADDHVGQGPPRAQAPLVNASASYYDTETRYSRCHISTIMS